MRVIRSGSAPSSHAPCEARAATSSSRRPGRFGSRSVVGGRSPQPVDLCEPSFAGEHSRRTVDLCARAFAGERSRRGTTLVLFAMLVFAFMGISAVAIDLAFASITQSEMQNAVDTAAIEGARLRDYGPYRSFGDKNRRPRV